MVDFRGKSSATQDFHYEKNMVEHEACNPNIFFHGEQHDTNNDSCGEPNPIIIPHFTTWGGFHSPQNTGLTHEWFVGRPNLNESA
jgi:hypothetical protein